MTIELRNVFEQVNNRELSSYNRHERRSVGKCVAKRVNETQKKLQDHKGSPVVALFIIVELQRKRFDLTGEQRVE